jgi:hypothetical protein
MPSFHLREPVVLVGESSKQAEYGILHGAPFGEAGALETDLHSSVVIGEYEVASWLWYAFRTRAPNEKMGIVRRSINKEIELLRPP